MKNKKTIKNLSIVSKRLLRPGLVLLLAALLLASPVAGVINYSGLINPADPNGDLELDGDFTAPHFPGAWTLTKPSNKSQIMGYASASSLMPGTSVGLDVSCSVSTKFKADIFRMGNYDGQGALKVGQINPTGCNKQKPATTNTTTGLVDTNWSQTYRLVIPKTWQPGYYLTRLTRLDGYQAYIPFLVSSPSSPAPTNKYLFVNAVNTSEAYNSWGGSSLYVGRAAGGKVNHAFKVSLNRPYASNNGAGEFLDWEYSMVKFLDKYNYHVDYATDIQVNNNPDLLKKYKGVILAGHNEYWTWPMLAGYKNSVQHGVNLAVFASNTDYRPTRIEPDPTTHQADRIIVCYKAYQLDPQYATYTNALKSHYQHLKSLTNLPTVEQYQVTGFNWRDSPFNLPESELLGSSLLGQIDKPSSLVVNDASSWVFNGTGLKKGDSLPGLVGYEYDAYDTRLPLPPNVDILFSSPAGGRTADGTIYTSPGGGQVFNAGTNDWSWGLDQGLPPYSPSLVTVTSNILNNFGR